MNILLINGGKAYGPSQGRLNQSLHTHARDTLAALGHQTQETVIDDGYDVPAEIEKFLWMDAVIWQMPGWWMGEPWIVKEYVDHVFSAGFGKLFASDGRHRTGDFFDGAGVDAVYLHFHKANEFLGMKPLPTYICNDVVKNPQIARFLADYTTHLQRLFPA